MSLIFRGLAEPQMHQLRDNLFLLESSDPGARRVGLSTNSYAIAVADRVLLFDMGVSPLVPFVRQLRDRGFAPAGLVLSHRHVARNGDAVHALATEFAIPVLLHPLDAHHPEAAIDVRYEDPMGHPLLAAFGLAALHVPGHTAGHIMLYGADQGGLLLTSDAAMGPTAAQAESGMERLVRPPIDMEVDDAQLRERWQSFDLHVATVLPYHGTGYMDRADDLPTIMDPLRRPEPTLGMLG